MWFVWIIYCYFVDPFSLLGKLFPSSGLSWANPRLARSRTYVPWLLFLWSEPLTQDRFRALLVRGTAGHRGRSRVVPAGGPRPKSSAPAGFYPHPPSGSPTRPAVPKRAGRELPAGGGFSRRAWSGESWAEPRGRGQASPGRRCAAELRSPELSNFTRRETARARGVPHPRLGAHPSPALPSPFARSDPAACVFPGGGRQTAGHCVIHVPRSPMCVAVCVTDGAPGEYEGRGVNFLLKGPNTCVRSFLYYF